MAGNLSRNAAESGESSSKCGVRCLFAVFLVSELTCFLFSVHQNKYLSSMSIFAFLFTAISTSMTNTSAAMRRDTVVTGLRRSFRMNLHGMVLRRISGASKCWRPASCSLLGKFPLASSTFLSLRSLYCFAQFTPVPASVPALQQRLRTLQEVESCLQFSKNSNSGSSLISTAIF